MGLSLSRVLKRELLNSGFLPKLGSLLAKSAFRRFAKVVDYAEYGGAPLLGLQNISIVCHGRSNAKAICNPHGDPVRRERDQQAPDGNHLRQ